MRNHNPIQGLGDGDELLVWGFVHESDWTTIPDTWEVAAFALVTRDIPDPPPPVIVDMTGRLRSRVNSFG